MSKWFDDVFLSSIFERTGHSRKWLTQKQTAVCTQNMTISHVRFLTDGINYGVHDNYFYSWRGRDVFLCYSKKNGCGQIEFGYTPEEIEVLRRIENERKERERLANIAFLRAERPEKYSARIAKIKALISRLEREKQDFEEELRHAKINHESAELIADIELDISYKREQIEKKQKELILWEEEK